MNTCRICHCTERAPCMVHGIPCIWLSADLCSRCAELTDVLAAPDGVSWVLAVTSAATARPWTPAWQRLEPPPRQAEPAAEIPSGDLPAICAVCKARPAVYLCSHVLGWKAAAWDLAPSGAHSCDCPLCEVCAQPVAAGFTSGDAGGIEILTRHLCQEHAERVLCWAPSISRDVLTDEAADERRWWTNKENAADGQTNAAGI